MTSQQCCSRHSASLHDYQALDAGKRRQAAADFFFGGAYTWKRDPGKQKPVRFVILQAFDTQALDPRSSVHQILMLP